MKRLKEIDLPFALDSIAGIPMSWFREINAACDAFFARRGIHYENSFINNIRSGIVIATAQREARRKTKQAHE